MYITTYYSRPGPCVGSRTLGLGRSSGGHGQGQADARARSVNESFLRKYKPASARALVELALRRAPFFGSQRGPCVQKVRRLFNRGLRHAFVVRDVHKEGLRMGISN